MPFRRFDITIQDLQIFVAVAECLSFSDAARLLGKSQPSISSRIKLLEEKLQKQLIIRDVKSIHLSEEGLDLQTYALKLVNEMAAFHDNFHENGKKRKYTVNVCSPILSSSAIIGPTIEKLQKIHPEITVRLEEDIQANCVQRVVDGTAVIAILSKFDFPPELEFRPIFRDICKAVSAAGHPLTRRKSASLSEILRYPILSPDINILLREELENEARKRNIKISYVPEARGVTNYLSLLSMAASNMGVAIVSTGLLPDSLRTILSTTDIDDCQFPRVFGLVTARNRRLSRSAEAFCEHLAEAGLQLEATNRVS